jgi:hypothetical protein
MDGTERDKPSSKSQILHVFCSFVESKHKMIMMIIMGHKCKRSTMGGISRIGEEERKSY